MTPLARTVEVFIAEMDPLPVRVVDNLRQFTNYADERGSYFLLALTERAKREHPDDAHKSNAMMLMELCGLVETQTRMIATMSQSLTDLETAETTATSTMDAAVQAMTAATALLNELAARITAAGTDPAELASITSDLQTHAASLQTMTGAFNDLVTSMAAGTTTASTTSASTTPTAPADAPVSALPVTSEATTGTTQPSPTTLGGTANDLPPPAAAI
jgi:hypothetical protein